MDEHDRTTQEFEQIQTYLQFLGRLQVHGRMQAKVDISGVVQRTLLEAHQDQDAWRPLPEKRRLAWLRQVFSNNLQDEIRRFNTQRRDVNREQSIHQQVEDSACRVNEWLAADISSPSSQSVKEDETLRLARALDQLAADQRTAVEMHHLEGLPLADVAEHLQRSREAAAMLVYRGVTKLRHLLADSDEE